MNVTNSALLVLFPVVVRNMFVGAKDMEIENAIKNWLKFAPSRVVTKEKRKNKMEPPFHSTTEQDDN